MTFSDRPISLLEIAAGDDHGGFDTTLRRAGGKPPALVGGKRRSYLWSRGSMFVLTLVALQALAAPPVSAASCRAGTGLPIVVRIDGFRYRSGQVRVRLFGDPPSTYFDKRKALVRIEVPVPATGRVEICVPAPRPGVYAVDVRHDGNLNGKTDRQDGGGVSGNPRVSLLDMLLSRKPAPATVQFRVGTGTTIVPVTLMYLQGGSFRPVKHGE